ncbi:MAG: acetate kinase [Lachnospiraceae bacterium]|nr:acetate kinase [Lachnospiraceae bacterium]
MKILVLNCGSSSLKYQLIDGDTEKVLAKGLCERIGIEGSQLKHEPAGKEKVVFTEYMKDHTDAVKMVIDALLDANHGVVKSVGEIGAIGHRVVHAGEEFSGSVVITEKVKQALRKCCELAPLHNPANLIGIEACEKIMPGVPQVGVFDTAFHQTMPEKAYLYALPYEYYEKYKIRKYGFHGTSHKFVSQEALKLMGKKSADGTKIITCHLGNGGSICAVLNGKSVDTSMGFTPLEGLVMGTRSGDIDPAIVTYIMGKENLSTAEMDNVLNKKSGVLGISGVSSDFRDIEEAEKAGNARAKAALDIFAYRVAKYIGSYVAAMNGVDAIVFTAGLGENSRSMREKICAYLGFLGVKLDAEKNGMRGKAMPISSSDSKVQVLVIPTNEELMIARDTKELLDK